MAVRNDDLQLAFTTRSDQIQLLEISSQEIVRMLHNIGAVPGAWSIAFAPDGNILAVGETTGVRFWDVNARSPLGFVKLDDPRSVMFSPNGDGLITSGSRGLLMWKSPWQEPANSESRGEEPLSLCSSGPHLESVANADGTKFLAADQKNSQALFLDLTEGKTPKALGPHDKIQEVALSPDARFAATAPWGGSEVKVWSISSQTLITNFPGQFAHVAFSLDGKWLASSTMNDVKIYQTESWELRQQLKLRDATDGLKPIAFSPDSALLAVGNRPYDIQLFDPPSGQRLAVITHPQPTVLSAITFSPDGRTLSGVQWDGSVQLWDLQKLHAELAKLGLDWE
jgi:WD40 repeat protein